MSTEYQEFICKDCGTSVRRAFVDGEEASLPVCLNCQWIRRHASQMLVRIFDEMDAADAARENV